MTAMKFFVFSLCAFVLVLCVPAYAQNRQDKEREEALLGLNYIAANYATLSQLTWKFGMHPLTNDSAIDDYMRIANCSLYQDYYTNDFLWQRIREGTRREIKYYAQNFPDRFELTAGIELGRYDFRKSAFIIPEDYQLSNAGNLQVPARDSHIGECRLGRKNILFPANIRLSIDNPFSLLEIPVPPDDAKPLIDRLAQYRYKDMKNERLAVMRIRVRMTDIKEYSPNEIYPYIVFKGQLDEIAIFEDPALKKLIWKKSFKDLD